LLWDLEHPERFYLIFTKAQWQSWLVKGAFIIAGYSVLLLAHFVISIMGYHSASSDSLISFPARVVPWAEQALKLLMIAGVPLGIMTAVYTAYLFAQAKARDLWQNPLLPPHLLVQALLLGSAALLPFTSWFEAPAQSDSGALPPLLWLLAITSLIHLLMIWGEVSLTHATAHARVAVWEMIRGRYRSDFWFGVGLSALGGVLAWLAVLGVISSTLGVGAAPLALIGMMLFENAYVQAGQSVPLA
jgi:formate-dependent nitrite reductase membrane component NrfD